MDTSSANPDAGQNIEGLDRRGLPQRSVGHRRVVHDRWTCRRSPDFLGQKHLRRADRRDIGLRP